jgi:hypothetical protein
MMSLTTSMKPDPTLRPRPAAYRWENAGVDLRFLK